MSRFIAVLLFLATALIADQTTVLFAPSNPRVGPFPTDELTVPDARQLTGRRVALPLPDCGAQPTLCAQLSLVNQLDGFNIQPRIAVSFSAAVDTSTLRGGIYFLKLRDFARRRVAIAANQIAWDPATNTAYAKPDAPLDQHSRYLLIITDSVHDAAGAPVAPDRAFTDCLRNEDDPYCRDLAHSIRSSEHAVAASIFTTQSATAWLESAHRQLQSMPIVVRRPDSRSIFNLSDVTALTVNYDAGSGGLLSTSYPITDPAFATLFGSLGRLAFGSYLAPTVLNAQQTIDPTPTAADVALPTPVIQIDFHVYLPKTPPPPHGYPVVIFGHAFGDSSMGGPTIVAPRFALDGFATIAINAYGHGYGPGSNVTLTETSGVTTTIPLGGRGIDRNGDGAIESTEGCVVLTPLPLGARDCLRQTTVDLLQLVRAIQSGVDLDGDGVPDLDGGRIYYAGQSLGAIYGTIFSAVEPAVRATALNVGGGSIIDIVRWSPGFQDIASKILTSQNPPLQPVGTPFLDNFPFRDGPVAINTPGASDTQYLLELIEWLDNSGDPIPFAPHLQRAPFAGRTATPVLFQMARGDAVVPNPASSDLARAAGVQSSVWLYRHDLALSLYPDQLPADPHSYLALFLGSSSTTDLKLAQLAIGLAAQSQMSGFFLADGASIPDMSQILRGPLFEIPQNLPNDLGIPPRITQQKAATRQITNGESRRPYIPKGSRPPG